MKWTTDPSHPFSLYRNEERDERVNMSDAVAILLLSFVSVITPIAERAAFCFGVGHFAFNKEV